MSDELHPKIQQGKSDLILDQPFFATLLMRLRLRSDDTIVQPNGVPGVGYTDGSSIVYNPKFIDLMPQKEVNAFLIHEVLHCALKHPFRLGNRNSWRWNHACDYAVNACIKNMNYERATISEHWLYDKQYENMSAEEIYSKLPKSIDNEMECPICVHGKDGKHVPGNGPSMKGCKGMVGEVRQPESGNLDAAEAEWNAAVKAAAKLENKSQGHLPADLKRLIDIATRPVIDWKAVLRRFMQENARADYSWKLPNRRFLSYGLYMPGLKSEQMPTVAVAIDTSGSIGEKELNSFASEINSIVRECAPEMTIVLYCDAKVHHVEEFLPNDDITLKPIGGGGTDFRPVFNWLNEREIACLIYLTDLMGTFPERAPEYPVLWVHTYEGTMPFGEAIFLDLNAD